MAISQFCSIAIRNKKKLVVFFIILLLLFSYRYAQFRPNSHNHNRENFPNGHGWRTAMVCCMWNVCIALVYMAQILNGIPIRRDSNKYQISINPIVIKIGITWVWVQSNTFDFPIHIPFIATSVFSLYRTNITEAIQAHTHPRAQTEAEQHISSNVFVCA